MDVLGIVVLIFIAGVFIALRGTNRLLKRVIQDIHNANIEINIAKHHISTLYSMPCIMKDMMMKGMFTTKGESGYSGRTFSTSGEENGGNKTTDR